MPRQFLRREVRVGNQRRCIAAEGRQSLINRRVAEFMIGGVHDVAGIAVDTIGERSAGMVQAAAR